MRSVLSRVFRYGIATARADHDVAADLRGALITPKVQHLAAITTPKEAGGLLRAIEGYTGHEITAIALRLSPHLFVRPGELRSAEWTEFDTQGAIWSLSAEKMKMRRPHRVPLSRQVLDMLEELHALTGDGRFLFPSFRSPKQCMSENTVNAALRRLGYSQEEMTAHGFRAMAATLLNEMGIWNVQPPASLSTWSKFVVRTSARWRSAQSMIRRWCRNGRQSDIDLQNSACSAPVRPCDFSSTTS
jgi:integrase